MEGKIAKTGGEKVAEEDANNAENDDADTAVATAEPAVGPSKPEASMCQ